MNTCEAVVIKIPELSTDITGVRDLGHEVMIFMFERRNRVGNIYFEMGDDDRTTISRCMIIIAQTISVPQSMSRLERSSGIDSQLCSRWRQGE